MKDITRKPLVKDPIEDVNQENRNNKEFFHAMQSHFIRNDLQKIIFMLELVKMGNQQNLDEQIDKMYKICNRANKKLETINRIHKVIHSNFTNPNESSSLIGLIEETGSFFNFSIKIDYDSLKYKITADGFFKDLLYELLSFINNSNGDQVGISGRRCPDNPDYYVLRISESKNELFTQDICD